MPMASMVSKSPGVAVLPVIATRIGIKSAPVSAPVPWRAYASLFQDRSGEIRHPFQDLYGCRQEVMDSRGTLLSGQEFRGRTGISSLEEVGGLFADPREKLYPLLTSGIIRTR